MAHGARRLHICNHISTLEIRVKIEKTLYILFDSGVQVLLDAFAIENVMAFGLDSIFGDIVA